MANTTFSMSATFLPRTVSVTVQPSQSSQTACQFSFQSTIRIDSGLEMVTNAPQTSDSEECI
jgi:hypothetical protein